jgi:glycosyltransferase involved in cell wall biosynthesis
MRILFILPYIPNLVRVRAFNFIRALAARGHEVSLFAVDDGSGEHDDIDAIARICTRVETVRLTKRQAGWNMLGALLSNLPLQAAYAWKPSSIFRSSARSLLANIGQEFDVVHVEHMRASRYGLSLRAAVQAERHPIPVIYDSVDCLSALFRLTAENAPRPIHHWIAQFELQRNEPYESWLLSQFDRVLVTSTADRQALLDLQDNHGKDAEITVVPNGVDLDYFHPFDQPRRDADTIILTGKMSYHANIAMCKYFVEEILPLIWKTKPDVRLLVVGKNPPAVIRSFARDQRIHVTGTVPDLPDYFQQASIAVAPLVYGVGIQNKILEAMACGLPVVATKQGIEALDAQDGRDLLVAEKPSGFAERVIELLGDPALRARLGRNAREYVEIHHDWNHIAMILEEIYVDVINNG